MLHCWKDYSDFVEDQGHRYGSDVWVFAFMHPATCMLEAGHGGDHEWTPDDDAEVCFPVIEKGGT